MNIIAFAGGIGAGKTHAAEVIPGAYSLAWADPLYRGLSAVLGVPEQLLRHRTTKDGVISVAGLPIRVRRALETLGTEWGRDCISRELIVRLTMNEIDRVAAATQFETFAVCSTRFPEEIAAVRERGGEVWWIDRPAAELVKTEHKSGNSITRGGCDRIIVNTDNQQQFRALLLQAWADFSTRVPPGVQ